MPKYHIENSPINSTVKEYVKNTNSKLKIHSVTTGNSVEFPAFLTDFSQTFDATWNTEDVFGRMDPIATYQGTKRTMSLGFDVPAGNVDEAKWNLKTCSLLMSMVYPVYNNIAGSQVLSKPPLVRIQFANLIRTTVEVGTVTSAGTGNETEQQRLNRLKENRSEFNNLELGEQRGDVTAVVNPLGGLLGWISGLSWKPTLENGMFAEGGELYPKMISISFSFNILHEKVLDQNRVANTNWPFGG